MIHTVKKLFLVSRPISWPNTSYPFLVGYLLATGGSFTSWSLLTCIVGTVYFLGPYNLLMYGINDIFDYESDIKNPRKGGIEGMKESRALHPAIIKAVVFTNVPFLLYLFLAGTLMSGVVLTLVVCAAVAYSIKGLRFKEIPFLDSVTSSFHFVGPLIFALSLTSFPEGSWVWISAFFLWGMASHAFGAVQDIIPDRKASIHSIATALGASRTIILSAGLYAGAVVLTISQGVAFLGIALVGCTYFFNIISYIFIEDKDSARTNTAWRRFIWLNYISGAIITMTIIARMQ